MVNPITTVFASVKAKLNQLLAGIKKYLNPRYLARLVNVQVKKMVQTLFSVKPKSREDFYSVGTLLISKKLAILIVVLINLGCIVLLLNLLPAKAPAGTKAEQKIPSYKYTSLRLVGFNGEAQVLSSSGNLVYKGLLEKGIAKGEGTLYDLKGNLVYKGQFDKNMYNGKGTVYYENGDVLYVGDFVNNLYSGNGVLYNKQNIKEYEGEFLGSQKSGKGTSYGNDGQTTHEGQYLSNHIDYLRLLGMPSSELTCYKGKSKLYESKYTTAVRYDDVNLIYEIEPQQDGENKIIRCYDIGGFTSGISPITAEKIREKLGEPIYYGDATLNDADYVALNIFSETSFSENNADDKIMKAIINEKYKFAIETLSEETYQIKPQSFETIYIETYMSGEYCYTYYFVDKTKPYLFCSVEKVGS